MNENQKALEVLKFAINNEIKAFNFYNYIASKIEDRSVRYMCKNLAGDEKIHRMILEDRYKHLSEGEDCVVENEVNYENIPSVCSLGRDELIEMAIKLERNAQEYYLNQSKIIEDSKSAEVLLDLYNTEKEHEEKLKTLLVTKD